MFKRNIEKTQEQENKKGNGLRNVALFFGGFAAGAGTVYGAMKYVEHNRAIDDLLDNGVVDSDEDYPVEPDDPQGPVDGSGSVTKENDEEGVDEHDNVVSDSIDGERNLEEDSKIVDEPVLKSFEEELAATSEEMVGTEDPDFSGNNPELAEKLTRIIGLPVTYARRGFVTDELRPIRICVNKPFAPSNMKPYSKMAAKLEDLSFDPTYMRSDWIWQQYSLDDYIVSKEYDEKRRNRMYDRVARFTIDVTNTRGFIGFSMVLDPIKVEEAIRHLDELDEGETLPDEIVDDPRINESENLPEEIVDGPEDDGTENLPDEIIDDEPEDNPENKEAPAPEVEFTTRMHAVIDDIEKLANEKKFVEAKKLYRSTLLPMVNELEHLDEKLAPLAKVIENVGSRLTEKMMEERDKAVEASKASDQKYPAKKKGGKKNGRNKKSQPEEPVVVPSQVQTLAR